MVESMRRQDFACLRGGKRMKKRGFKNREAAPHKFLSNKNWRRRTSLYSRIALHLKLG
jgi:hypothetical protein